MDLEKLNPDRVEEIFARHGAQSITLSDAGNEAVLEPAPGDTPLWPELRITALFPAEVDLDMLRDDLKQSLEIDALPSHDIEVLEDRAWEREWLRDFRPMRFGTRLWICPGDSEVDDSNAVIIKLDPGLAFGTGTHATTALCLDWLDGQPLHDKTMLDYGCGSGVLAIAALKLGAAAATAMDIDPQAVMATRDNAVRNHVEDRLTTTIDPDDIEVTFDVVVANILAGPLIELAEPVAGFVETGCRLALSGILCEQVEDVLAAYNPWIEFDEPVFRDQGGQTWARLTGRRIEG